MNLNQEYVVSDDFEDPPKFLSREECARLFTHAARVAQGGGVTEIRIHSQWRASVRWARNRVSATSDIRDHRVTAIRTINKANGSYTVNQIDDTSLTTAVGYAEWFQRLKTEGDKFPDIEFDMPHLTPTIWSDNTYRLEAAARNNAVQPLMDLAESAGMLSAGYIQINAGGAAVLTSDGLRRYYPYTQAQYSVTVREPHGNGSGWAGVDLYDWTRIDTPTLTQRALTKCITSLNPVRIEPGRFTTILEPQAVADMFRIIMEYLNRDYNETKPDWPFYLDKGLSKIGLKLLDERVTVSADVMDADLGWVPFNWQGEPYLPAVWFDRGVLRNLSYDHKYAVQTLGKNEPLLNSLACRISGGETSLDDMIKTTKRGLLVTRFDRILLEDKRSLLCTGYTRDGLWLIENGAISKAVKNFRFTESPLFAFNNIRELGRPERVFSPLAPMVVPPMKIDDFSFTSLTDAI